MLPPSSAERSSRERDSRIEYGRAFARSFHQLMQRTRVAFPILVADRLQLGFDSSVMLDRLDRVLSRAASFCLFSSDFRRAGSRWKSLDTLDERDTPQPAALNQRVQNGRIGRDGRDSSGSVNAESVVPRSCALLPSLKDALSGANLPAIARLERWLLVPDRYQGILKPKPDSKGWPWWSCAEPIFRA